MDHTTGNFAQCHAWCVVHAEQLIAGKLFEQAIIDHGLGAADTFFRRLENEIDLAAKTSRGSQVLGRPQQHGGVTVVAAGVHGALVGRAVCESIFFADR